MEVIEFNYRKPTKLKVNLVKGFPLGDDLVSKFVSELMGVKERREVVRKAFEQFKKERNID